jgi:hypothetical protein
MRELLGAIAIVAFVAIAAAQEPQRVRDTFSITGYVIDTDGHRHLVASAEVHASPADRGGLESMSLTTAGRFTLSVVGPGRYWVFAFKDNKGYREIDEALIRLDPEGIPEVVVTEQSPKQVTVIRLRPRAAKLTIRLVDVVTGRPLDRAQLVLTSEDNPKRQYTRSLTAFDKKNGEIRLLLPSFPLTIEASAPGYESWSYRETGAKERTSVLLLAPDETREITVGLRPMKKAR